MSVVAHDHDTANLTPDGAKAFEAAIIVAATWRSDMQAE
jgi:hypothetical protein